MLEQGLSVVEDLIVQVTVVVNFFEAESIGVLTLTTEGEPTTEAKPG